MGKYFSFYLLIILGLCSLHGFSQSTVTDIDGNVYPTVIIGEQEWMAANLRVTRYRNGDLILSGQPHTFWRGSQEGIWAWYDDNAINDNLYGKLYNWYATIDPRGLCPAGWRMPTDEDWEVLTLFVDPDIFGNLNVAGTRLKSRRQVDSPLGAPWNTIEHPRWEKHGNRFGTDNFGFAAMPGGGKTLGNSFIHRGQYAYFWSKTPWQENNAWTRVIEFSRSGISRSAYQRYMGFSVRCLKGPDVEESVFNLTTKGSPVQAGMVTGTGQYVSGAEVLVSAVARRDYSFTAWTRGQDTLSTHPSFKYTMPGENATITANFRNNILAADTEFWFAVPKVTQGHDWDRRRFYFRISAYRQPAVVTISMPANPGFVPIEFSLAANETNTTDITDRILQVWNENPNQIYNRGIQITSTGLVSAYFEVGTPNNPDIFTLKGREALGNSFYVPFQDHFYNGNYNPSPYSGIYIVATEDNTKVEITPTNSVFPGRPAGVPFTITLNRGQTIAVVPDQYTSTGQPANNRLGGTRINADKPIAVSTSDDSVAANPYGGCRDLVGDQIVPVSHVGKEYVAMRGRLGVGGSPTMPEFVFITGTRNNTQVYVDGALRATINAGEQFRWQFTAQRHHIKSSEPVYVYHVTGFGCEMGGALLPPVDRCAGSNTVHFTRSKGESFFVNILVRTGAEDSFIFNGQGPNTVIKASDFMPVPGNSGWLAAEYEFNQTQVPVGVTTRIENLKDIFHAGIINGGPSTGTMYGYFSGFRSCSDDVVDVPATYHLSLQVSPDQAGAVTGAGTYTPGQNVTMSATPMPGFAFTHWSRNGLTVSTQATFAYTMPAGNVTLVAHFEELAIAPKNQIVVLDTQGTNGNQITVEVEMNNHDQVVAYQMDIALPNGFSFIPGSYVLSDRSQGHVAMQNVLSGNILRVLAYSITNNSFMGNSGVLFRFSLNTPSQVGSWNLEPENIILTNAQTLNVFTDALGGIVKLIEDGIDAVDCGENVTFFYNGIEVTYGTVLGTAGRCWLDRNLGASHVATSSTDEGSYGDLFQWGRGADGHQLRTSGTTFNLSSTNSPGHNQFIIVPNSPWDWRSQKNDTLWQGVDGVNNVCPAGFRLPTEDEWADERLSWEDNNSIGAMTSPLKLPLAGSRFASTASLSNVGSGGGYWSSTVGGIYLSYFSINIHVASTVYHYRANGYSIRCIKDDLRKDAD